MTKNSVPYCQPPLGCDPEFFFTSGGKVIGAEKVLPEGGLAASSGSKSKFTVDGVCVELNPAAMGCRANLGNEIGKCFRDLQAHCKKGKLGTAFNSLVTLKQAELDALSDKSKEFGCDPSHNVHTGKTSGVKVGDPNTFPTRVAGGHIHIGRKDDTVVNVNWALERPAILIPMLDLILGNTCVLIDRDQGSTERRKLYGKAGEYRTPAHGIEYRVLSNFWLRSYPLMSLVMGLARTALLITAHSKDDPKILERFIGAVPVGKVRQAINNNDAELAFKIYFRIEEALVQVAGDRRDNWPINDSTNDAFHHFISKPLDYWFKTDPLEHWSKLPDGHECGIETFLSRDVAKDAKKDGKR